MNNYATKKLDKPQDECGVFGIFSEKEGLDVARLTHFALFALQHRGQESCGIAVNDHESVVYHKNLGLVPEVFDDVILNHLKGKIAIGHVRYAKYSENSRENAQPLVMKYVKGTLSIAQNASLVNAKSLREELDSQGVFFQGNSDAELVAHLIAKERLFTHSVEDALLKIMKKMSGAYAIVIMTPTKLIAVRDPLGMKPLSIGKLGDSYVVASETVAFDTINAEFVRDVLPGEIISITKDGLTSIPPEKETEGKMCIFEHIYIARPDSVIEGASVYEARKEAGRYLAKEHPVDADVVIAVPDSGIGAAIGYAEEANIPYEVGLMKNRYVARTFIQPTQEMRENAVRIKLNAIKNVVCGKRVVMVDDSIVRGTTSYRIVKLLREAGAKEVHMRVASSPYLYPCYFGTDVGTVEELFAVGKTIEEMRDLIGVDSLGFLSLENMLKTPIGSKTKFCTACFDGKYPLDISEVEK